MTIAGTAGALALLVLFLWLSALGARSAARAATATVQPVRKPVLSARRTPDVLSFVTRTGRVRSALTPLSAGLPSDSCLVVSWLGADLASVRAGNPLVPGSAAKIITAAVALDVLGPDTTFQTKVVATKNPDGSVADLFLVGGGDPLLVRNEYVATEKYRTINQT